MKILICGSRNIFPKGLIQQIVSVFPADTIIIEGAAKGVDKTAGYVARSRGLLVREFPANWSLHGNRAGPLRNQLMLEQGPDLVIAIHEDPLLGKGTRDMVTRARQAGVPVSVFIVK